MTKKRKVNKKIDIRKKVMSEIKSGHVTMKPRIYFLVGSILTGFGIASSLFSTLAIITFTFFRVRRFGLMGLLWQGKPLFAPMPILVLIFSLFALWGGLKLIKRCEFAYKYNFISIVITVITLVLTLGFLFDNLGANKHLERNPRLKPYYQQNQPGFSPKPDKMHQPRRLYRR